LKRSPTIVSVTSGYGLPGDQFAGESVKIPGKGDQEFSISLFIGDHDYVKTLGLKLIAGRDFSRDMKTDEREGFIINETAVKDFGFGTPQSAIGQRINWNEWEPADTTDPVKRGKVIGVVRDFHYKSLHEKVTASVIQLYPAVNFKVAAKIKTADMSGAIAHINNVGINFHPATRSIISLWTRPMAQCIKQRKSWPALFGYLPSWPSLLAAWDCLDWQHLVPSSVQKK
jgi:putative ABC transport system permease protein